MTVVLNGKLTLDDLISVVKNRADVRLNEEIKARVKKSRDKLEKLIETSQEPMYGITTGFGELAKDKIPFSQQRQLQINLIRSHSAGVGEPLPEEMVRGIITLRVNSLGMGYSGVRVEILEKLISLLNGGVVPYVPRKGSVGASGDLVPLAHVASVLIGEGKAYLKGELLSGAEALRRTGIEPVKLREKEGLALINGTQAMVSLIAIKLSEARKLVKYADLIGGLTTYLIGGNFTQFDPQIYRVRPHNTHGLVATNLRKLTNYNPSGYKPKSVQDPYSLRCIPQVHGSVRTALRHAEEVIEVEMNSVTDNPLIFGDTNRVISGGNFHGEPVALVADYLKVALCELGNISERRVNRMLHPSLNDDLPDFLASNPGTNSGLMLAQYTSAALVSENKGLAFPSAVDTIPVSGDQEDHVSMGMNGANNLCQIVDNLQNILAIELITASQARVFKNVDLPKPLEEFYRIIRRDIPIIEKDRELSSLIEKASNLLTRGGLLDELSDKYDIQ